jgi:hypothetical protein
MSEWVSEAAFNSEMTAAFGAVRIAQLRADGRWQNLWKVPSSTLLAMGTAGQAAGVLHVKLRQLGLLDVPAAEWLLSIPSLGQDGFPIDVMRRPDGLRVWFGGLEQDFETLEDALFWVGRALSGDYRLAIVSVGSQVSEWRLEPVTGSTSAADMLAFGHPSLLRMFKTTSTVHQCNALPWGQDVSAQRHGAEFPAEQLQLPWLPLGAGATDRNPVTS